MQLEVRGKIIETDAVGYLSHFKDWDAVVAGVLAEKEELALTEAHWEVIGVLRAAYEETGDGLSMHALQATLTQQLGEEKGSFAYLYQLFPLGPIKQGYRLAGLPRPRAES